MHILIAEAYEAAWEVLSRGVVEEVGAGDGARTRRSACLEGSVSQNRRSPGIDRLLMPIRKVFL
jgi:hypothetical protein